VKAFTALIIGRDVRIVESWRPKRVSLDMGAELHVRSDRSAVEYRRWLKRLDAGASSLSAQMRDDRIGTVNEGPLRNMVPFDAVFVIHATPRNTICVAGQALPRLRGDASMRRRRTPRQWSGRPDGRAPASAKGGRTWRGWRSRHGRPVPAVAVIKPRLAGRIGLVCIVQEAREL
jgi:hypothetical protein